MFYYCISSTLIFPSSYSGCTGVMVPRKPANPQTRKPTLRLGTAQKASEVRYTLIIFTFSLIYVKRCLSIISVLLSLFHCTHSRKPANPQTLITWEPCKWQCLIYLISFLLFSFHYLLLVSKEVRVLNFNCFFCFRKGPLIDNKFAAPTWLQTLVVRQAVFLQKGLPLDYFCDSECIQAVPVKTAFLGFSSPEKKSDYF